MVICGIDPGSSNCRVAAFTERSLKTLTNSSGESTTPSYVLFNGDEIKVGKSAKNASFESGKTLVYDMKSLIGKLYSSQEVEIYIALKNWPFVVKKGGNGQSKIVIETPQGKRYYSSEQILSFVLKEIKKVVDEYQKLQYGSIPILSSVLYALRSEHTVVLTVPTNFNKYQRKATKESAQLAGFVVEQLINESSAATLAYCYKTFETSHRKPKIWRSILVYNIGGATFDVSIMKIHKGEITVEYLDGSSRLGGNNFDTKLVEFCMKKFEEQTGENMRENNHGLLQLRNAVIKAKEKLSTVSHHKIFIEALQNGKDFEYDLMRSEFENENKVLFDKTMTIVDSILYGANLSPENIDQVFMVGCSCRIPIIQEMLKLKFSAEKINKTVNPEEAISFGAAVQAAILQNKIKSSFILLDAIPNALGVHVKQCACTNRFFCFCKANVCSIVSKNSKIPFSKTGTFEFVTNFEKSVEIKIYEATTFSWKLVNSYMFNDIPSQEKIKITTTFEIDEDNIFRATSKVVNDSALSYVMGLFRKNAVLKFDFTAARKPEPVTSDNFISDSLFSRIKNIF